MRVKTTFFVILVLSVVLFTFSQIDVKAEEKTIVVPDDYSTIQEAIQNADEGDTIFVKKGIYDGPINETLRINKTISLMGEENTTLNLHPLLLNTTLFYSPYLTHNTSIRVEANNVTISGFTFNTPAPGGGISVTGDGIQIINCNVTPSMSLTGSYSTISKSILKSNLNVNGSNQTISQCSIKRDIGLTGSYNNLIGNAIDAEIDLKGSYNIISDNSFYRIFLEHSDSNKIHNNTFSCIWIGLYGHTCSNNTVSRNILDGGYIWGILMGDGFNNVFYDNYITNYGTFGVGIGGNHQVAENNTFYHNAFVNNNKNVGYNWDQHGAGNFWDNGFEGNYWDDYTGIDANGDGIGDTPYVIDEKNQDNFPLMEPIVIPEFPSWTILPLFLITTLIVIVYRKSLKRKYTS